RGDRSSAARSPARHDRGRWSDRGSEENDGRSWSDTISNQATKTRNHERQPRGKCNHEGSKARRGTVRRAARSAVTRRKATGHESFAYPRGLVPARFLPRVWGLLRRPTRRTADFALLRVLCLRGVPLSHGCSVTVKAAGRE